ncbi:MAG: acyl-CoA reductase [Cyclobacteriaceae bacterium]
MNKRIEAFGWLGQYLEQLPPADWRDPTARAIKQNPWFDHISIRIAVEAISQNLKTTLLEQWLSPYKMKDNDSRLIGVIMAGNIPLVGFNDFLCVLATGHRIAVKLSTQDNVLLPIIAGFLTKQFPGFKEYITFEDSIKQANAVIATGSDNSARYFSYYFKEIPYIIRKNRSSIAILDGGESKENIAALGDDVFTYFGLGCRNVSKLLLPKGCDIKKLMVVWKDHEAVLKHQKYARNYRFQKAVMSMNNQEYYDNGFILLTNKEDVIAPISVLNYQYYEHQEDLVKKVELHQHKTQCIVSQAGWYPGSIAFGQAQYPRLWDYADQVDTVQFLTDLT